MPFMPADLAAPVVMVSKAPFVFQTSGSVNQVKELACLNI